MKNNKKSSFEKILYETLKVNGFLFPTTDEQVEEFEKGIGRTHVELPDNLKDATQYSYKEEKVIKQSPKNKTVESYHLLVASKNSSKSKSGKGKKK